MALSRCYFCRHLNPEAAKFCNECASALNLRACDSCDAINDVVANHCHQCGVPFDAPIPVPEVEIARLTEGIVQPPSSIVGEGAMRDLTGPVELTVARSSIELASAAERLETFWRESTPAVLTLPETNPRAGARDRSGHPLLLEHEGAIEGSAASILPHVFPHAGRGRVHAARAAAVLLVAAVVSYGVFERHADSSPAANSQLFTATANPATPDRAQPMVTAPIVTSAETTVPVAAEASADATPIDAAPIDAAPIVAAPIVAAPIVAAPEDPARVDAAPVIVVPAVPSESSAATSAPPDSAKSRSANVSALPVPGTGAARKRSPARSSPYASVARGFAPQRAPPMLAAPDVTRSRGSEATANCTDGVAALGLCDPVQRSARP